MLFRSASLYLNLPKSMIRHTGGFAVGAISTKSSCASSANRLASARLTIPIGSLSGPSSRTSVTLVISVLIRTSFSVAIKLSQTLLLILGVDSQHLKLLAQINPNHDTAFVAIPDLMCEIKLSRLIGGIFSPPPLPSRTRAVTLFDCISLSPKISRKGTFCTLCSRIL